MATQALAERARPVIDDSLGYNRLLSDKGTLLRGVSISWDGGDPYGSQDKFMPTQESLDALAQVYGYNALHIVTVYLNRYLIVVSLDLKV